MILCDQLDDALIISKKKKRDIEVYVLYLLQSHINSSTPSLLSSVQAIHHHNHDFALSLQLTQHEHHNPLGIGLSSHDFYKEGKPVKPSSAPHAITLTHLPPYIQADISHPTLFLEVPKPPLPYHRPQPSSPPPVPSLSPLSSPPNISLQKRTDSNNSAPYPHLHTPRSTCRSKPAAW